MNKLGNLGSKTAQRIRFDRLSYFVSGLCALIYAWGVSLTDYRQTGLQFVTPLLIIFVVQSVWCLVSVGITQNLFFQITRRTLQTTFIVLFGLVLFAALIPQPAHGDVREVVGGVAGILFCFVVLFGVCLMLGVGIFYIFKAIKKIYRLIRPKANDDDNHKNVKEVASIIVTCTLLLAASAEGVKGAYSFGSLSSSSATQLINASEERVWQSLGTATQPDVPLPLLISAFPQPVAVVVDEGVALNANRVVKIKGREGEGFLTLRVVERTDHRAKFQVLSDTSPIANWVTHRTLEYRVEESGGAIKLSVTLEYDRLLAPAWFFNPLMRGAAYLGMDVLARDVKSRAEQGFDST